MPREKLPPTLLLETPREEPRPYNRGKQEKKRERKGRVKWYGERKVSMIARKRKIPPSGTLMNAL
jgi:hypothetical protein